MQRYTICFAVQDKDGENVDFFDKYDEAVKFAGTEYDIKLEIYDILKNICEYQLLPNDKINQ
jgi:hypothetical protein